MLTQANIERLMHPYHIINDLKNTLTKDIETEIIQGKKIIKDWYDTPTTRVKKERRNIVVNLDLTDLITGLIAQTMLTCQSPIKLISFSQMYSIPNMEKLDSMKTVMELIAILEPLDLYQLTQNQDGTYMIESLLIPSEDIQNRNTLSCYLPPMIEKPKELKHNKSSPLKTIQTDSLILGRNQNYHTNNICLDVLNKQNSNQYELDKDTLNQYEKEFHREVLTDKEFDLLSQAEQEQYNQEYATYLTYKEQFKVLANNLQDKILYLCNKVDKRGRIYVQGFHFSTQGTSYEKACINLKTKEYVTGEL